MLKGRCSINATQSSVAIMGQPFLFAKSRESSILARSVITPGLTAHASNPSSSPAKSKTAFSTSPCAIDKTPQILLQPSRFGLGWLRTRSYSRIGTAWQETNLRALGCRRASICGKCAWLLLGQLPPTWAA
ncbi:unnamed protein product [Mycena citricolor]|uniref:Uncharacterized protein n=1 Tax=Mycena citricolor TaxID=2018698 RepID=A0AAD2H3Q6_9AGAR|nr:unnamed protein product [Mycena citricolor]